MAHYGTLGTHRFNLDVDDIRGADVFGSNDEKLGTIDDVIFDHQSGNVQYCVIDTGGWLSTQKFLVPADRLRERTGHDDDFAIDMTREQVHNLPAYDDKMVDDSRAFNDYETRYREKWTVGPVMHKEGSTHILTPEADEMPAVSASDLGGVDVTPTRLADPRSDADANPSKLRMRPAGSAARVEDARKPGIALGKDDASLQRPEAIADSNIERIDARSGLRDFETTGGVDDIGYGDIDQTAVPRLDSDVPASFPNTVEDRLDDTHDLDRPYPVENARASRFRAFEENLRRNRVDITASCRSCDIERKKAA